jgi:hypothetical protein
MERSFNRAVKSAPLKQKRQSDSHTIFAAGKCISRQAWFRGFPIIALASDLEKVSIGFSVLESNKPA